MSVSKQNKAQVVDPLKPTAKPSEPYVREATQSGSQEPSHAGNDIILTQHKNQFITLLSPDLELLQI